MLLVIPAHDFIAQSPAPSHMVQQQEASRTVPATALFLATVQSRECNLIPILLWVERKDKK
jgi:hypothetical protein